MQLPFISFYASFRNPVGEVHILPDESFRPGYPVHNIISRAWLVWQSPFHRLGRPNKFHEFRSPAMQFSVLIFCIIDVPRTFREIPGKTPSYIILNSEFGSDNTIQGVQMIKIPGFCKSEGSIFIEFKRGNTGVLVHVVTEGPGFFTKLVKYIDIHVP